MKRNGCYFLSARLGGYFVMACVLLFSGQWASASDDFCQIIEGKKPAIFVNTGRLDDVIVIEKNMQPRYPADVLIIPKQHIVDFADLAFESTSCQAQTLVRNIWKAVLKLRAKLHNPQAPFQLFINHGSNRGVDHLHVHFLSPDSYWEEPDWLKTHNVSAQNTGRRAVANDNIPYNLSIDQNGELFLGVLKAAKAEAGHSSTLYFDCNGKKARAWMMRGSEMLDIGTKVGLYAKLTRKGHAVQSSHEPAGGRSAQSNNEPPATQKKSLLSAKFVMGALAVAVTCLCGYFLKTYASSKK